MSLYKIDAAWHSIQGGICRYLNVELHFVSKQGAHDIPKAAAVRRFQRSWQNFTSVYRPIADAWIVYDNSENKARLLKKDHEKEHDE